MEDSSRFKIGMWGRQTGKSTSCALEAIADMIQHKGAVWVVMSRSQSQSDEFIRKAAGIARAVEAAGKKLGLDITQDGNVSTVNLSNGSRMIGFPAKPETARSYSGNVILDEFAFHDHPDEIWKAVFPSISLGHNIRIISTPNGLGNRFAEMWNEPKGPWSKHRITAPEAADAGLPINLDEIYEGLNDDIAWRQEYLCEFVDEATAWLPYDLIRNCEDETAGTLEDYTPGVSLYAGWDVARWNDLSVFTLLERVGDVCWVRLVEVFAHSSFQNQLDRVKGIIDAFNVERVAVDATGMGEMPAEQLEREYGDWRIDKVKFTQDHKASLAGITKRAFERKLIRIPSQAELRDDLHSVQRTQTPTGGVRFAGQSGKSHADRFWSLSLALSAAEQPSGVRITVL